MVLPKNRRAKRPLLVATIGLATLTLTLEGCLSCGNLIAPPPQEPGPDAGVDASRDGAPDSGSGSADSGSADSGSADSGSADAR